MKSRLCLLLFAILSLPVQAAAAVTLGELNGRVVDDHLIPRYQQLAAASTALAERSDALCAAPDAAGLAATRAAYHTAMDAWQGIAHVRFGPVALLLRHHRFQLWPDKRNTGGRQLAQLLAAADPAALDPEQVAQGSVALQGFSVLERLLFAQGPRPEPVVGYRCAVVRAVAHNLAAMSAALVSDWTVGPGAYRQQLRQPNEDNGLESELGVSSRLLNNLDAQLQSIIEQKLGRPLAAGRLRPRRAEAWRSGRSLRNIAINLAALRELYLSGFAPLLVARADGPALDQRLRDAFAAAVTAAVALDRPLAELAADPAGRAGLDALAARVITLKGLAGGDLPRALDIPLGFNSLDGD